MASGHLGIWAWDFKATKAREEILPEVLQPDVSGGCECVALGYYIVNIVVWNPRVTPE